MKKTYKVKEIFYTLQGEGYHSGEPAVFVRFSGCNLSCAWCDTDHLKGCEMTADEIIQSVRALWHASTAPFVVLTGGEPALQLDTELIRALNTLEAYIAIETNGTREIPEGIDWITCSPKPHTLVKLHSVNEVKVVFDGVINPELWRKELHAEHWLLQPLHNGTSSNIDETVNYILTHPTWCLSVQLHKILGFK